MNVWADFGAILLWMLWAVMFIGYLFALFAVIADLFRDHTLNGWWKAVWVLFLVFVPFITVLVYLIARGEGMAQRSHRAALDADAAARSYIREATAKSPSEEIETASALLKAGTITSDEFAALKAKALA